MKSLPGMDLIALLGLQDVQPGLPLLDGAAWLEQAIPQSAIGGDGIQDAVASALELQLGAAVVAFDELPPPRQVMAASLALMARGDQRTASAIQDRAGSRSAWALEETLCDSGREAGREGWDAFRDNNAYQTTLLRSLCRAAAEHASLRLQQFAWLRAADRTAYAILADFGRPYPLAEASAVRFHHLVEDLAKRPVRRSDFSALVDRILWPERAASA